MGTTPDSRMTPLTRRSIPMLPAVTIAGSQLVMTLSMLALLLSVPAISKTFASNVSTTITVIALFNLCVSIFVLLAAMVSNQIGRRWTYLLGLGCFALGTAMAMVSQSFLGLILGFSLLGGIGKALVVAIIGRLVGDHYPVPTNVQMGSRITGMVTVGTVVGLCAMLGISAAFGWRWSFAVVALLALADLVLAHRVIRLVPRRGAARGFDPSGVVVAMVGTTLIVVGFLVANSWGWLRGRGGGPIEPFGLSLVPFMILAGVLLFHWFLQGQRARQRAGKSIVVPVGALKQRRLIFSIVLMALQQLMAVGIVVLLPLFLALGLDYGATWTALALTPLLAGIALATMNPNTFTERIEPERLYHLGVALVILGAFALIGVMEPDTEPFDLAIPLLVLGFGYGLIVALIGRVMGQRVAASDAPAMTALQGTLRSIGQAFGVAALGAVLITSVSVGVIASTEESAALVEPQRSVVLSELHDVPSKYISAVAYEALLAGAGVGAEAQSELLDGHAQAQVDGMRWLMLAVAVAAVACLLMTRGPRISAARREAASQALASTQPAPEAIL